MDLTKQSKMVLAHRIMQAVLETNIYKDCKFKHVTPDQWQIPIYEAIFNALHEVNEAEQLMMV